MHGTTIVINAITERKGAKVGAAHHRGLPRHPRDRPRQPAGLLQPGVPEADALRAAPSAPRAAGPHHLQGRGDQSRSTCPGCRRSWTTSAPRASRRSRSASSTPTPTRRTRGERWRRVQANSGPRSRSSPRTRSRASGASTSAPTRPFSRPTCSRSPTATWTA